MCAYIKTHSNNFPMYSVFKSLSNVFHFWNHFQLIPRLKPFPMYSYFKILFNRFLYQNTFQYNPFLNTFKRIPILKPSPIYFYIKALSNAFPFPWIPISKLFSIQFSIKTFSNTFLYQNALQWIATSKHLQLHIYIKALFCPVSRGCRIHWLHLCWGVRPP